ncbi:MAG: Ig-like domain-containing protein [Candidatus Sericytochromatia bacterium]|nr:Ig-like domain-containing protein [Candidatus Sericytochromatia bacterium]
MRLLQVLLAASAVLISSCAGTGQNTMPAFNVQRGTITLAVDIPPEQGDISSVEFRVDGEVLAVDSQGPEFSVPFDTTKKADGIHFVEAVGNPGAAEVQLLKNSILVENAAPAPAPAAYRRAKLLMTPAR